jgi:hypothetical protein
MPTTPASQTRPAASPLPDRGPSRRRGAIGGAASLFVRTGVSPMTRLLATTSLAAALAAAAVAAPDHEAPILALLDGGLRAEIATPEVIAAVRAQNAKHAALDQAAIDALDAQWRNEVDSGGGPLVDAVLGAAVSAYLRDVQSKHQGMLTEVFVMDDKGLNVAQSDPTSDYWQGDEAKWRETYGSGGDVVFVDAVEMDESTQTLQSQVSFTLIDPATGEAVGAVTAGVNVEVLMQ